MCTAQHLGWFGMTGVGITMMPTDHNSLPNICDDLGWPALVWPWCAQLNIWDDLEWFGMTGIEMTMMPTAHNSLPNIWDDLGWPALGWPWWAQPNIWDDLDWPALGWPWCPQPTAHYPTALTLRADWSLVHFALFDPEAWPCFPVNAIHTDPSVQYSEKIQGMIRDHAQKAWNKRIFTPLINLGHGHQHWSPPSPSPPRLLVLFLPMKWILCVVFTNYILVLVLLRCDEKTLITLIGKSSKKDRKGRVSPLGLDCKQMWKFWFIFSLKFDSLMIKTHFISLWGVSKMHFSPPLTHPLYRYLIIWQSSSKQ